MTYFDFMDFEPVRFISSNSNNRKILSASKLTESPTYVEAPGFESSDIEAEIKHGDLLHIKGNTDKYGKRSFEQVLVISESIDKDSINMTVGNGVITIEFTDKKKESRKIKVK